MSGSAGLAIFIVAIIILEIVRIILSSSVDIKTQISIVKGEAQQAASLNDLLQKRIDDLETLEERIYSLEEKRDKKLNSSEDS